VGDALKPASAGWQGAPGESEFVPYMIVWALPGQFNGTIGDPQDDAELSYQVTCVGETREQAEWVADKAIDALVGQTITVTGRSVMQYIELGDTGTTRRDDDVKPSVFIATPRFDVYTTPGS
jgi:hypothetical protein